MLFLIPFIGYKETIGSYTSNETQDLQEPTPEEINQNYDSENINEEQSSNVPNAQFLTGSMTGIQETGRRNEDEVNLPSTSKQPLNTKRRQAGEHERLEKANSKRKCQPKSSITDDKLIEIISNKEDADEQFMLSCVPFLKQLTPQNNLMARIHIQNLLYKLAYENNHNYHTRLSTSMSTTTPIPQPSPHPQRLVFCLHQPLIIQEIVLRLLTTKLEIAMPSFAKIPQHPFSICNNIL